MFINILSFLKALDIQVTKLEVKHQGVFFSREPTVPTVNRIIVHFYDNSQAPSTLRAVTSSGRSVRPGKTTARRVAKRWNYSNP